MSAAALVTSLRLEAGASSVDGVELVDGQRGVEVPDVDARARAGEAGRPQRRGDGVVDAGRGGRRAQGPAAGERGDEQDEQEE